MSIKQRAIALALATQIWIPTAFATPKLEKVVEKAEMREVAQCQRDSDKVERDCAKDCRQEDRGRKLTCTFGDDVIKRACANSCLEAFDACSEGANDSFVACGETCRASYKSTWNSCKLEATPCSATCLLCRNEATTDLRTCHINCQSEKREQKILEGCVAVIRTCLESCK